MYRKNFKKLDFILFREIFVCESSFNIKHFVSAKVMITAMLMQ